MHCKMANDQSFESDRGIPTDPELQTSDLSENLQDSDLTHELALGESSAEKALISPEDIIENSADEISSGSQLPIPSTPDPFDEFMEKAEIEPRPDTELINEVNTEVTTDQSSGLLSEEELLASEVRMAEEKLSKLQSQQDQLNKQLESLDEEIEDYLGVLEDLSQWIDERKRSFAWRLLESTRIRENLLSNDEEKLRSYSKSPIELDSNFAPKTRKWVLKNILGNWSITLFAILITLYVRRNRDELLASLAEPSTSSFLSSLQNLLRSLIQNVNVPLYLTIIFFISSLYFLGTLFGYSRRISRHTREIDSEAFKARQIAKAVDEVRDSRERLDSLYPQLPQILEVMSMALHEPYQIDHRYYEFKGTLPDTNDIPESLEFAAPTEESIDRVFEALVLKTLNEIQKVGWRQELLKLTLQQVGESVGIGLLSPAVEEIENDQRRLGKRHLLLNLSPETKARPLTSIGDQLVSKYAEIVQEKVLPTSQPEVKSLRPDPLEKLELSDSLGANLDSQISHWEKKLTEAAGHTAPWSTINFSNEGQSHGKHLDPIESIFIASKQAISEVPSSISAFAEIDPGTRPFEVSIRADLSSWCKPGDLAIFEGLATSESSLHESDNNEDVDEAVNSEVVY